MKKEGVPHVRNIHRYVQTLMSNACSIYTTWIKMPGGQGSSSARKDPFLCLSFWWVLAILGVPWFSAASLSPWSHGVLPVCLCPDFPLLVRTPLTGLGLVLLLTCPTS